MWEIVIAVALVLGCVVAVAMTMLRLPGNWLIVVCALGYGWWSDWQRVGVGVLLVLVGFAAVGEVVELLASVLTARKAGASRQAMWGGLIGGLVGMVLLSFLVPIPILGTAIGALVGCFGGAFLGEWRVRKELAGGAKVGLFTALGFVLGTIAKVAIALIMSGVLLTRLL